MHPTPNSQFPTPNSPAKRIGVIGGSFDPIHMAHLIMAETVREVLSLDLVLFVPVREQPLKIGREATPAEHRVAMTALAIKDNPHFALSRIDVDRPGPSYTVDTLKTVREQWGNPDLALWFIVGADSLSTFPTWHDPHGILEQTRLAVVRRPGTVVDLPQLVAAIPELGSSLDWVDAPLIGISATDLRRRVSQGLSIRYRVPEAVRHYIDGNGLYMRSLEG